MNEPYIHANNPLPPPLNFHNEYPQTNTLLDAYFAELMVNGKTVIHIAEQSSDIVQLLQQVDCEIKPHTAKQS